MELSVGSIAVVMAFAVDLIFGELPNRWHPVAWLGRGIAFFCRVAPTTGRFVPMAAGFLLVGSGAAACAVLGWRIEQFASGRSLVVAALLQAVVLKQTFSISSLAQAANAVAAAIRGGDLAAARHQLAFHLVSRDTSHLSESQVAAAAIESVAENASDSIVAPLFWFAIAGLPGALIYRFTNTCDAMVGYRTARFEWLGKPAARIDDVLNLIPARLTAGIMCIVGVMVAERPLAGVSVWRRDRHATASPNAGHPMSATAGVLGIELEKVGHYTLGSGQRRPNASDIVRAVRLMWVTSGIATASAVFWLLGKGTL